MKILVVTECFWPDIYAVNDIVEKLVSRGHAVTVLTGLPDYTTSLIPPEYRHGRNRHQEYKGADVYRVPTVARRHGPIWRSLSYLSFAFNGSLKARFHDFSRTAVWDDGFDVIYVWEVSPVTMAVPAITLKKKYHKPLFLYCMDIWPECVKAMNIKEGTIAYKLIHAWTKRIYRQCDHIAVSSKPFFEYMEQVNGISRDVMSYLPQFGDGSLLNIDTAKRVANTGAGGDGTSCVDLLFIGNIGKAQCLDTLIRAMAVFKDDTQQSAGAHVHLHMVGGGSDYDRIRALSAELGLDDIITFYGPVPFRESLEFYNRADACVLTLDGSTHIGDTLPGKLQTYMAAGKPVIASANGAAAEIISEAGCGICVPAGDSDALGQALKKYADDPAAYSDCGENARRYFRDHF
ncbi:MAG: glycosyltransferase family 4 protein, partial [Lachnospiraceae bacterium]|nr:glycosyltransferase family 4 protein [Lachnospiraceae bacterium]